MFTLFLLAAEANWMVPCHSTKMWNLETLFYLGNISSPPRKTPEFTN